jgi:hypothetical protein
MALGATSFTKKVIQLIRVYNKIKLSQDMKDFKEDYVCKRLK